MGIHGCYLPTVGPSMWSRRGRSARWQGRNECGGAKKSPSLLSVPDAPSPHYSTTTSGTRHSPARQFAAPYRGSLGQRLWALEVSQGAVADSGTKLSAFHRVLERAFPVALPLLFLHDWEKARYNGRHLLHCLGPLHARTMAVAGARESEETSALHSTPTQHLGLRVRARIHRSYAGMRLIGALADHADRAHPPTNAPIVPGWAQISPETAKPLIRTTGFHYHLSYSHWHWRSPPRKAFRVVRPAQRNYGTRRGKDTGIRRCGAIGLLCVSQTMPITAQNCELIISHPHEGR